MSYTAEFCVMQQELISYANATGKRLNYPELCHTLFHKGMAQENAPEVSSSLLEDMSEEKFFENIAHRALPVFADTVKTEKNLKEDTLFLANEDVFLLQHFYDISSYLHTHEYFEIAYVYRGNMEMQFEKEKRILHEGEMCIIAPGSVHGMNLPHPGGITFLIVIRQSTFNNSFFSLLSGKDLLATFCRNALYGTSGANYLIFKTDNSEEIRRTIRLMMYNCMIGDDFSNSCCISLVNLLFARVLRHYGETAQFYNYDMNKDFTVIFQYIQHNYLHATLREVAEMYHYSEAHMSVIIKKKTGHSFSEWITLMKMNDACDYLESTDMKVSEISYVTGYSSPDHFSRTFQKNKGMSPTEYREMAQRGMQNASHTETA